MPGVEYFLATRAPWSGEESRKRMLEEGKPWSPARAADEKPSPEMLTISRVEFNKLLDEEYFRGHADSKKYGETPF